MKTLTTCLFSLFLSCSFSLASLSLGWTGDPRADHFAVYEKGLAGVYSLIGTVPAAPGVTTYAFLLVNPSPGPHTYAATAVSVNRLETAKSPDITLPALPSAPVNLRFTP